MTEPRPQVTDTENLVQYGRIWFLRHASGQTDRHTDTLITILCTHIEGEIATNGISFESYFPVVLKWSVIKLIEAHSQCPLETDRKRKQKWKINFWPKTKMTENIENRRFGAENETGFRSFTITTHPPCALDWWVHSVDGRQLADVTTPSSGSCRAADLPQAAAETAPSHDSSCRQYYATNSRNITGPPTHSVGAGQTSNGRWRLSSSVTLAYAT